MESFFSLLERRVDDCSSLLCVGLDPHGNELPEQSAAAARDFCIRIIKATAPYAAAFKPNAAFFEAFGSEGWTALKQVIAAAREESEKAGSHIPVILDAKRGDIASTAEAYAASAFRNLGADCITLSPYLGRDSIEPFIRQPEKGAFLLCKTSNPAAGDLQDVTVDGGQLAVGPRLMFEYVALLAQKWNTNGNVGLVVGATYPQTLERVRELVPDLWFLVPGVGTQGGDLGSALKAGLRNDGKGVLVNVSRGISRSADPAKAAAEIRDQIRDIREQRIETVTTSNHPFSNHPVSNPLVPVLADSLLAAGCIKFGDFTLKSGLQSPVYIDLRQIISYPRLLDQIGAAYLPILKGLQFDRIAGLPYAAIPIATSVSLQGGYPMIYPRKEVKAYGTKAEIEGEYRAGETVVVVDDLATTGGSKFEAIQKLTGAGLKVKDVVVLVDRQSGAKEALAQAGYAMHAVLTITEMLDYWEQNGKVPQDKIAQTREFLKANK